jgi:hypothetical protein
MAIDAVLAGLIAAWRWRWGPAAAVVFGGFLPAAWRRAYFQIPPERVVELGTQLEICPERARGSLAPFIVKSFRAARLSPG